MSTFRAKQTLAGLDAKLLLLAKLSTAIRIISSSLLIALPYEVTAHAIQARKRSSRVVAEFG